MRKANASLLALALAALGCTVCSAYIATPLVGYQQGLTLQVNTPAVSGSQCVVYGVPTPTGYADPASTPLFLNTPKNTGSHVLQFVYNQNAYNLSPFLAPGQTTLQIDATVPTNPLITFDSNQSPQGQSGTVTIYLSDKASGTIYCSSQIQFYVDLPLSCLPTYGGINANSNGNGNGQVVVISGSVYTPAFVQQTIINQYVTINNININQVTVNVNQITNTTIINNIVNVLPPSPSPVNCTATPKNPACAPPPGPVVPPSPVPPMPGPTPAPTTPPPAPGPPITVAPTLTATPTPTPTVSPPTTAIPTLTAAPTPPPTPPSTTTPTTTSTSTPTSTPTVLPQTGSSTVTPTPPVGTGTNIGRRMKT